MDDSYTMVQEFCENHFGGAEARRKEGEGEARAQKKHVALRFVAAGPRMLENVSGKNRTLPSITLRGPTKNRLLSHKETPGKM